MALSAIATTLAALAVAALATGPVCESSVLIGGSSPNQWTATGRSSEPVAAGVVAPAPVQTPASSPTEQSNATSPSYAANVLEAISSVGNAIRQQISGAGAAEQVHIITSPSGAASGAADTNQQIGNSKQVSSLALSTRRVAPSISANHTDSPSAPSTTRRTSTSPSD